MSEYCLHDNQDDFLDDIEYSETIEYKELALLYTCSNCGGQYTKYYQVKKSQLSNPKNNNSERTQG